MKQGKPAARQRLPTDTESATPVRASAVSGEACLDRWCVLDRVRWDLDAGNVLQGVRGLETLLPVSGHRWRMATGTSHQPAPPQPALSRRGARQ
jgi:hypothetical protein